MMKEKTNKELLHELYKAKKQIVKLKKAKKTFEQLVDQSKIFFAYEKVPYFIIDDNATIVDANERFEELTGYDKNSIVDTKLSDLQIFSKKNNAVLQKRIKDFGTRKIITPIRFPIKKKNKKYINGELILFPLKIKKRRLILILLNDVTDEKMLQNRQNQREKYDKLRAIIWEIANGATSEKELILELLSKIGEALGITRASFIKFHYDLNKAVCDLQWCLKNIKPTLGITVPIVKNDTILKSSYMILTPDTIPEQLKQDFSIFFTKYSIATILAVRLGSNDSPEGLITVESNDPEFVWTDDEIILLLELVKIISVRVAQIRNSEKIQSKEEQYRLITENASDLIATIDLSGIFTYVSPSHKELGYDPADLYGKKCINYLHPDDKKVILEELNKAKKEDPAKIGINKKYDLRIISTDGKYHHLESISKLIIDKNERFSILMMSRDITARKMAEMELKQYHDQLEELVKERTSSLSDANIKMQKEITERKAIEDKLRNSEENFRQISENSLMGIVIIQDKDFKYVNNAFAKISGCKLTEIINWKRNDFIHIIYEHDRPKIVGKIFDKNNKNYHQVSSYRIMTPDNEIKWIEQYSNEITYENKDARLLTFIDITKRKQAEAKIREREENLSVTLDSIGDGVIVTDAKGRIIRMNPISEKLTGWKIEEVRDTELLNVFNIINKNTNKPITNPVDIVLKENRTVTLSSNTILISKDGTKRQIADSGAPIHDKNGTIIGVIIVFRDITEEYKLQQQLHQSEKMQTIGKLAGGIAHDFNNLIGGIMGFADLIKLSTNEDDDLGKYAESILDTSRRAASLTSQLLTFARRQEIERKEIDIHGIIEIVIGILSHTIDRRIKIIKKLNADPSFTMGDMSQLQNAILNIAINARDAMQSEGELIFSTTNISIDKRFCEKHSLNLSPGVYIELDISDTGIGIDKNTIKHIFDPFFTTKEVGKGTGLGLSTVYGTVNDHKGAINVNSEPGMGTIFKIFLPVAANMTKNNEITDENKILPGKGNIMVVDDEDIIRDVIKTMLKKLGYKAILCENGYEGLEQYKKNQNEIDLILLDMVMPRMNGREAYFEIKKINPNARIIICSGFNLGVSKIDVDTDKYLDYLQKPFNISDLSKKITNMLELP